MPTKTIPEVDTLADLLKRLGNVPSKRILMHPAPGTATEKDALAYHEAGRKRLVELVDGVLVEKTMGTRESLLAGVLLVHLYTFVRKRRLGKVLPADGALRVMPQMVRIPDVCFISWDRIPDGIPKKGFARVAPNLAVEVLSEGNTKGEMQRKLKDYFIAGVTVVWFIYPKTETADIYLAPDRVTKVATSGVLVAEEILPGFELSLADLFAEADETAPEE